ncbi:peptide-methionine (S)-S-oxide reductase MsrA [Prochlorococcus marinus str. MU1402]|uniref:peptide-methionine (S)-S-oxide reductase MsrA n=1 Tax=Prochlorococcus marinus TaxID=1219 RepID=UPI001ADAAE68|nr:peptide-methionine (S)-S-oxide reductase MsrA [Prochlorococcus marinus]MBO8231908.1 peptide-methionine (S)-S-oxide reductase MsrA [Prochlorococcus marinus XMU1402]MBW3056654.1 peptide-methionine (S)-S-oxide reductase MsrA [Prochlorococcus marinus str. MU1402]
MFEFLKKIMNNEKLILINDGNLFHRILKSDIRKDPNSQEDEIIFGCGCFWGAEKCFWKLPGVVTTSVGYAGGSKSNPTYYEVCSGLTGHAEVVRVIWDKSKIDISDLLKMFWECHNPTQKDRQGNDIGSQYRSAIYYKNENNKKIILASKEQYQKELNKKNLGFIETEIKKINNYFYAEDYHQQYLASEGSRQYCSASPTKVKLGIFTGSNFKLKDYVWENFNWEVEKCVLRSDNKPVKE